jgi:hypothetical protein
MPPADAQHTPDATHNATHRCAHGAPHHGPDRTGSPVPFRGAALGSSNDALRLGRQRKGEKGRKAGYGDDSMLQGPTFRW